MVAVGTLIAERPPGAGGGHPPPAPTERSMRICRTTLFGSWFTARQEIELACVGTATGVGDCSRGLVSSLYVGGSDVCAGPRREDGRLAADAGPSSRDDDDESFQGITLDESPDLWWVGDRTRRSSPSSCFLLDQPVDFSRLVSIGRMRMRLAVAAKIAFVTAGATTAVGASPKPPGASELLTRCVSTTGASSIRSGR